MGRLAAWLLAPFVLLALAGLFHIGARVAALEDRRTALQTTIAAEAEAIQVLRAEWAHLTRPSRLARLSRRHLAMAPLPASAIRDLSDLPVQLAVPGNRASPETAGLARSGRVAKTGLASGHLTGQDRASQDRAHVIPAPLPPARKVAPRRMEDVLADLLAPVHPPAPAGEGI